MISSIIVDDEERAIRSLVLLLEKYCPQVEVLATCSNIKEAQQKIEELKPKLLFLDINMPHGTGFDLLEQLQHSAGVIFTTAYQEYAIKALRLSAIDYLLKPIDPEELVLAVNRFSEVDQPQRITVFKDLIRSSELKRLALPSQTGIHLVDPHDIFYLTSDRNYTQFHLLDQILTIARTLGEYEDLLTEHGFFRIHRSHIVNLKHLVELRKGKDSIVVLSNGEKLEVARNRRDALHDLITM